jgi:hypothetical protein
VIIPVAVLLFLAGMAFTYFVMLPAALPFLLGIIEVETNITISSYFGLVTKLLFWVGVIFQFPLIIMGLATVGLVEAGSLLRGWRYAVAGISLVAAAITPTVDPVNMGIVMIQKGEYQKALTYFKNIKCKHNVALAQLLSGKTNEAMNNLKCAPESANTYYMLAVYGARTDNGEMVYEYLGKAIEKDSGLKSMAREDREFLNYFNEAAFKQIVN